MEYFTLSMIDNDFTVIPLTEPNEEKMAESISKSTRKTLFIYPSLSSDFAIRGFSNTGKSELDTLSLAFAAAKFFIEKRGLPLSDFTFETERGIVEVFHTPSGFYRAKAPCSFKILARQREVFGCDVTSYDLYSDFFVRAVRVDKFEGADRERFYSFFKLNEPLPDAVLFFSQEQGKVRFESIKRNGETGPSDLQLSALLASLIYRRGLCPLSEDAECETGIVFSCTGDGIYISVR